MSVAESMQDAGSMRLKCIEIIKSKNQLVTDVASKVELFFDRDVNTWQVQNELRVSELNGRSSVVI
jgi:hypothetical protein